MAKHFIEIDSVQKYFNTKPVLTDVYLKCETGEIIGLLGRNGSGKSTLLKIVLGILSADNKFIRVDGKVIFNTNDSLNEISYLSQENFIPSSFSVKRAIQLSIDKDKVADFYQDDFINSLKDKKIHQLSGGELRYLEIKLILSNSSKFVLLDEPYNGLSPIMIEKINQLITENSSKKGIIITDHNYENIIKISSRLILMKDGKTIQIKDKMELVEKGYLSKEII
ncbi:MAG: ATP-binding cassette domain-containing protein [Flavobacterium sp.]|uniref:ATP-binding cassette domain-containing protein n=1 Tax=Flavobacterium sp. TaxID=239 RepID=UPI0022C11E55|nr:ATP-binding cassette domain-containing protein [Flavobacterium sp.]MCZ8332504.1 ATP-binding cassette domain-containing protein [Flavobacterium sp.]